MTRHRRGFLRSNPALALASLRALASAATAPKQPTLAREDKVTWDGIVPTITDSVAVAKRAGATWMMVVPDQRTFAWFDDSGPWPDIAIARKGFL